MNISELIFEIEQGNLSKDRAAEITRNLLGAGAAAMLHRLVGLGCVSSTESIDISGEAFRVSGNNSVSA